METKLSSASKGRKKPEPTPILQSIFDGITDGIMVIDRSFKVVMYNKGMQRFMATQDDLEGVYCHFICHHNTVQCSDCLAQNAFNNVTPPSRIKTCFRDNLKRRFEILNFPIRNGDGGVDYVVEYVRDVTEKQGMEKELMSARRLAIIGEVAATAAHEIRNPLSAMAGAAHFLLNEYKDDRTIQKYARLMEEQIERLSRFTTNLLDSTRPKVDLGEKALINVPLLKSIDVLEEEARTKGVDVQIFLDEDLPPVRFDGERMQQVFINVLRNAFDAVEGGRGSVEIVGSLRQINGEDYLEVNFIDNGTGVQDQDKDRVFESFYTTKKNGTGLGLGIVKDIMKSHGGYVLMESGPHGGGACVRLGLPI